MRVLAGDCRMRFGRRGYLAVTPDAHRMLTIAQLS
jgi:hypothetical protein